MNLEKHIKFTLENLKNILNILKKKWFSSLNESHFLKLSKLNKNVLFIWWKQISWSLSPFIHNYNSYFLNEDKQFFYTLLDLSENDLDFEELLKYIEKNKSILWANVTMPYKIDIFNILKIQNKLTKYALEVWAVNVIWKKGWIIFWDNTDVFWIMEPIKNNLWKDIDKISNWYIIWAGWAGKAAIVSLLKLWINNITIFNRSDISEIINEFKEKNINIKYVEYDVLNNLKNNISDFIKNDSILINTLPFWFKENLPKSPILDNEFEKIKNKIYLYFDIVCDLNYWDTSLLEKFKNNNIKTCNWIDMLINQAEWWFKIWTNENDFKKYDLIKILK